jgi:DNA-binding HxlR family transcriptional regulator
MTEHAGYGQFCPVAMAAEILCARWTVLIVRELICGTTRFNDLRRGVPRMSPALLSKRLKELEQAGVIEAIRRSNITSPEPGAISNHSSWGSESGGSAGWNRGFLSRISIRRF